MSESLFKKKFQVSTCNFIKKDTLAQVFPCEYSKIFKNIFFTEQLQVNSLLPTNCLSVFDHLVGLAFEKNQVWEKTDNWIKQNSEKGFLMILGKIKVN